jgi:hypothetical protein
LGEGFRVRAKDDGVARVLNAFTKTVRRIEEIGIAGEKIQDGEGTICLQPNGH